MTTEIPALSVENIKILCREGYSRQYPDAVERLVVLLDIIERKPYRMDVVEL